MADQPVKSSPLAYVIQLLKILGLSQEEQVNTLGDLFLLIETKTTNAILENLPREKQGEFREKVEKLITAPEEYIEYLQKLSEDEQLRTRIEAPLNAVLEKIEDEFIQRATNKEKKEMLAWLAKNT